jgi:hypothetical protein
VQWVSCSPKPALSQPSGSNPFFLRVAIALLALSSTQTRNQIQMILIGSRALALRALAHQAPKLLFREPKDFDFVCTQDEFNSWLEKNSSKVKPTKVYAEKNKMIVEGATNCEFEIVGSAPSTEMMVKLVEGNAESVETPFGWVPTVDMLFTIKSSHKYLKNSPHFWKTLVDYHIMKRYGAVVRPEYQDFLKVREKETYNYAHPKLNQSKDGFFADDAIQYVYDHDTIHESVARGEKPAYTYYMKDGEQVQCDKNKFFDLPHEVRINGVIEEAAVLAIERSLVPHPGVWSPEYAWKFALSKVCSSITSGWFRAFAYENALEILKLYPAGYWEKFQEDVKTGKVKPFSGSKY